MSKSKKLKTTPRQKFSKGFLLKDTSGVQWEIQKIIGSGGFGYVYCGKKHGARSKEEYAIKTENMESGPLFVERMFYLKNIKDDEIKKWKTLKKLTELPIPTFYGFGSTLFNDNQYRFIVIEKFDKDLEKFLKSVPDNLLLGAVINIIRQIIDALEFIHERGYVHWDVKSQNIFVGNKPKHNHVYLGDFGMVKKYEIKDVVPNKKFANNGTQDYIALDGHLGMYTRRGDLESLMYNGLEWLRLPLPWKEKLLKNVIQMKTSLKDAILSNKELSEFKNVPKCYFKAMALIYRLEPAKKPNYSALKKLLKSYKTEK